MARVGRVSGERAQALTGWELARSEPDELSSPTELARLDGRWRPAVVPGTVAQALFDREPTFVDNEDYDASDFWYRTRFTAPAGPFTLRFGGLATLCEVWLDGVHLLSSDNMFVTHELPVDAGGSRQAELALCFRSLGHALDQRRGRPRWPARGLERPALRFARTTLFGRLPGFTPRLAPVGPWRPIERVEPGPIAVLSAAVRAMPEGEGGVVVARVVLSCGGGDSELRGASLVVGDARAALELSRGPEESVTLSGTLRLPHVELWWPHTHGPQPLYAVALELDVAGARIDIDLGKAGFRRLELSKEAGEFSLSVNGTPVFCRGACWLPLDARALDGSAAEIEKTLLLARDAGMNMIRVAAQGVYERATFFDRAAELGILIWHDFPFSRMDYPMDPSFCASVQHEVRQFLARTELCPALAVLCGNSEVEQQVAMLGLDPELGRHPLFEGVIRGVCAELRPDVPYVASSPSGGALPFHTDSGLSHYFGVGAYLRPLSDARRANLRFSSECLAFSNVPDAPMLERVLGGESVGSGWHWKATVPRDGGASWDFEDVRDHYLEELFRVDARQLRAADPERWLELGRVATAEAMAATIAELRRVGSSCRGALVWHLRDFVPGAGVGVIDASGMPKAAYWYLSRAFRPIALFLLDEGLNGLVAHAINETEKPVVAELVVTLYQDGRRGAERSTTALALPPRSAVKLSVDALLGRFVDTTHAYRFGPPAHDVTCAALVEHGSHRMLADAAHFTGGPPQARRADLGLSAQLSPHPAGFMLSLAATAFAYAVHVDAEGFTPDDDYFHLEPGRVRTLVLRADVVSERPISLRIVAVNGSAALRVRAEREERASA